MCENCPWLGNEDLYKMREFPIRVMKAVEDAQFSEKFKKNLRKRIFTSSVDQTNFQSMVKVFLDTLKTFKAHNRKRTLTFIVCDDCEQLEKLLQTYSNQSDPLIIKYMKGVRNMDTRKVWHDFQKLLKYYDIEDQKIVLAGTKWDTDQIRIKLDQVLFLQNQDSVSHYHLPPKHKAVTKELHYDREEIQETCDKVRTLIASSKPQLGPRTIRFFPRIVIVGPRGSGCQTQAQFLSERFKLVLVDAHDIVANDANEISSSCEKTRSSIINERLMQSDCLYRGYVLIGYPKTRAEMHSMLNAVVAPNRIIFMHAKKCLCYRRKLNQYCEHFLKPGMDPNEMTSKLKAILEDIDQSCHSLPQLVKIWGKRDGALHINANRCLINVRQEIFSWLSD